MASLRPDSEGIRDGRRVSPGVGTPALLAEIHRELAEASLDPDAVLRVLVDRCTELLGDAVGVRMVSPDRRFLEPGPYRHRDPAVLPFVDEMFREKLQPSDAGHTGQVVRTGEPLLIPEVPPDRPLTASTFQRYLDERGIVGVLLAPLSSRGRVLGVLHVSRDRGSPPYTVAEVELFLDLAERAGLMYDNARLYREVSARGAVLDQVEAAVITLDLEGRVSTLNPAAERLFGHAQADIVGRNFLEVLSAGPSSPVEVDLVRAAIRAGGWEGERRLTRADGRLFPARIRATPLLADDGTMVGTIGVYTDLTEERRTQALLQRRALQHEAVAGLGERALEGGDPDTLIDRATTAMAATLEGVVAVFEPVPGEDLLRIRSAAGFAEDPVGTTVPAGRSASLAGHVLATGRALLTADAAADPRFALAPVLAGADPGGAIGAVVQGRERPWGVIAAVAPHGMRFYEADLRFVQSLANVLADALDRWEADERQRHVALHDPLTGLPNRTLVCDRIEQGLARLIRGAGVVAVIFLDLDRFKVINDGLGHGAGDEVLTLLASRLRAAVRPQDTVGRFGGDEFVIVCEGVTGEEMARGIADRLLESIEAPFRIAGQDHHLSASIGIVLCDGSRANAEDLLRDADAAMYRAKESGRSRVEVFDEGMRARAIARMQIERELRRAIMGDELRVLYQPIVDLADGHVSGVEALVRWSHPQRGLLPPAEFVHIAEETGLVVELGHRVLALATTELQRRLPAGPDGRRPTLHVNLSAQQVALTDLVEIVDDVLRTSGWPAEALVLEVTETALLEPGGHAGHVLERLTRLGVRIVLDDFGTGYSSLSYLERFPISGLKIDRSFIAGLAHDEGKLPIVDAIVRLANALGIQSVAEGVEDEEQLRILTGLGCTAAQGYLFARPSPARELAAIVAGGTLRARARRAG